MSVKILNEILYMFFFIDLIRKFYNSFSLIAVFSVTIVRLFTLVTRYILGAQRGLRAIPCNKILSVFSGSHMHLLYGLLSSHLWKWGKGLVFLPHFFAPFFFLYRFAATKQKQGITNIYNAIFGIGELVTAIPDKNLLNCFI